MTKKVDPNETLEAREKRLKTRREYTERNRAVIRERRKHYRLVNDFGISLAEYQRLLAAQKGLCQICGQPNNRVERTLAVDHNHITGKLRGLLCDRCNLGLGHFNYNKELLKKAVDYLETHD